MIFDSLLYSEEAIKEAIWAFEEIATIHMEVQSDAFVCSVVISKCDLQLTCLEFANAALELSIMMDGNR